jgi:pimeloyl-ACP methyl ester carboxylesterase
LFFSSFYSAKDVFKTLRGINFSQKYLLPNIVSLNLFESVKSLETKIYFVQGMNDAAAPPELAKKYFDFLNAPKGKNFISFDNSAHMPHLEEPEKFRTLLFNEI